MKEEICLYNNRKECQKKNMFQMNVKTLIARRQKPVTKGTQKSAENMIWESVYIKSECAYNHLQSTKKSKS